MRNIAALLLLIVLSVSSSAQNESLLNSMVSVLNITSVSKITTWLGEKGYKEMSDPAFAQKGLRVFKKADPRGDETYILEFCGSSFTGYYTTLSTPEYVFLTDDLQKQGYKDAGGLYDKYSKNDISIEVVYDHSVVNSFGQSDTYGKRTKYVHVSRRNSCTGSGLSLPSDRTFSFRPSSLDECLANISLTPGDMPVLMAKSAFFATGSPAANGVVQFKKDENSIVVQYCEGAVKAFVVLLPKLEGQDLEKNLIKKGFTKGQEKGGDRNSFVRVYESADYAVVLTYYGDVKDEDDRDYAYQLVFGKKNTSCK